MITLYSDGTFEAEVNAPVVGHKWQEMTWTYQSKGEVLQLYRPGRNSYSVIEKKTREFSVRNNTSNRVLKFKRV
jgi:hypothetical protein